MKKFFSSLTKWETSKFGGYLRVLKDYPWITVPYTIKATIPHTDKDLNFSLYYTLSDIFLLKVKKYGLIDSLLLNSYNDERINYYGGVDKVIAIKNSSLEATVSLLIEKEDELKNLFEHFQDKLINIDYYIKVSENNEGEGEGGEDEGEDDSLNAKLNIAKKQLEKVKKSTYSSTSLTDPELKSKTKFRNQVKIGKSITYSQNDIKNVELFLRKLDINFEPKEDFIHNLKSGKIDSGKIAQVPAGNFNVFYRKEEEQTTRPFSVCILMDQSGSMMFRTGASYADKQYNLVKILYKSFSSIMPDEKIFVYGHTGYDAPVIYRYHNKYHSVLFDECFSSYHNVNFEENYDGPVVENIYEDVRKNTQDNILFISISDGYPAGHNYGGDAAVEELRAIIEKCKRDSFVTVGLGLDLSSHYLSNIYSYSASIPSSEDLLTAGVRIINHAVKTEFKD